MKSYPFCSFTDNSLQKQSFNGVSENKKTAQARFGLGLRRKRDLNIHLMNPNCILDAGKKQLFYAPINYHFD
jgi:hypothetical protein